MVITRPEVTAGPIDRALRPAKASSGLAAGGDCAQSAALAATVHRMMPIDLTRLMSNSFGPRHCTKRNQTVGPAEAGPHVLSSTHCRRLGVALGSVAGLAATRAPARLV